MEEQLIDDLVLYNTAELAKNKGFDVPVDRFFIVSTEKLYEDGDIFEVTNHNQFNDVVSAPTQSLLHKWIRKKYNIIIEISRGAHPNTFSVFINVLNENAGYIYDGNKIKEFNSYEEAYEEGLIRTLKIVT